MMKNRFDDIDLDTTLGILKKVAEGYAKESVEYAALEKAAHAVLFVSGPSTRREFAAYVESANSHLTDEQAAELRRMGLK